MIQRHVDYPTAYQRILARKREWTPVQPTAGLLVPGSEAALSRALSLRTLELPVGEFIRDGLSRDVPNEARELLESNVIDEERHDLALGYVANVHKPDTVDELEAFCIRDQVEQHPDHTVLKAMVLERSIFFVLLPMFRFLGDAGLRTVSADISTDEQNHVMANSLVCQQLGLTYSNSLDTLRKEIIQWVVAPLPEFNQENRYLSRSFWVQQSDNLLYTGKAEGLQETRRARMPAFFEHNNQNLPAYA